jgi:general secretion pathway protein D
MFMRSLYIVSLGLFIGACAQAPMKPSQSHVKADGPAPEGTIPAPVQISTVLPKPRPTQKPETYSVVVNNVSAQELLFALARDAKLNVDVNAGIRGVVTLNAIDQTLPQLLSRISKQIDMRWELDGPNLIVMPDSPYLRVYRVDYLNIERSTTGSVGVSSQISGGAAAGGGGGGGGGAGGNTSSTTVQNRSSNKFWETLVGNIKDLLHETDRVFPGGQAQGAAPQVPAPAPGAPAQGGQPGAVQPVAAAPAAANINFREAASVISNPEAGVLSIRATSRQHEKIQEFLDQVQSSAKRQVLIEATIAEVQLNNNYQRGIDWSLVRNGPGTLNAAQSAQGTSLAGINSSLLVMSYAAQGVGVTLRLLESFGNVRILSSPKISVLNNQTAILKVVDNRVYFTIRGETTSAANVGTTTTFTTTPNVVPVGFVMNVTPQISDTDTVLLNLKPSVTRIIGFVNDPNPTLANPCGVGVGSCNLTPIVSRIPEIQTREMESMIKVNSGQIAVMGGLIQDSNTDNEDTIPGLFQLPSFGALFGNRNRENRKTELVIFIRPMVVRDPSIDGDFRAFRDLAPDANFMSRPNPGKPLEGNSRP